jgi:hypothetical protein
MMNDQLSDSSIKIFHIPAYSQIAYRGAASAWTNNAFCTGGTPFCELEYIFQYTVDENRAEGVTTMTALKCHAGHTSAQKRCMHSINVRVLLIIPRQMGHFT